ANSSGSQKYDFRILKINFLKDVIQLPNRKSSADAKELQSVKDTQVALAKIGVGVTQEAQDIFDAMSKTWHKESIIVLDEVIINPPYDIENCKANIGSAELLARVRKV
ncbi:7318_t:CDS:2, partial [Racocetra persica]